jgi:hypothetical protein
MKLEKSVFFNEIRRIFIRFSTARHNFYIIMVFNNACFSFHVQISNMDQEMMTRFKEIIKEQMDANGGAVAGGSGNDVGKYIF